MSEELGRENERERVCVRERERERKREKLEIRKNFHQYWSQSSLKQLQQLTVEKADRQTYRQTEEQKEDISKSLIWIDRKKCTHTLTVLMDTKKS